MNGEKKFLLVAFCLTRMVSWLFVAFWRWKELLALGLVTLLVFVVISSMTVMLLGALNEQALRRQRVLYHSELPLDALVAHWADFARLSEARSALILELIGDAFLALSAEMSAHKEYVLFQHGSLRERPRFLTHGLDECITQLSEVCTRWSSVLYWLGHVHEEPDEVRAVVRQITEATRTQQRRVERLLLRVQEEQVQTLRRQEAGRS